MAPQHSRYNIRVDFFLLASAHMQRRSAVSGLRVPLMLALTLHVGEFCTQKGTTYFSFGVPAGKGQVLVRLTHRPVQTSDLSVARGLYGPRDFPSVLGGEGVNFGSLWCLTAVQPV